MAVSWSLLSSACWLVLAATTAAAVRSADVVAIAEPAALVDDVELF